MILRKRSLENGNCIVQQKLGDAHLTLSDLRKKLQNGDDSSCLYQKVVTPNAGDITSLK
jgi:hypothetical protein